jgi:drug/metabolite transporter (DMT)-like permease
MKMETRKQIYFLGSLWNFGFTISGLLLPGLTLWLMTGSWEGITGTLPRAFFALFWVAVGLFGIGYYLVSRDPDRNEAVIWTGCGGKLVVFLFFSYLFFHDYITLFGLLAGLGDFIWIFFFIAAQQGEVANAYS